MDYEILLNSQFSVELIGNSRETLFWNYYNDPRKNGFKNIDELIKLYPNLKLLERKKDL